MVNSIPRQRAGGDRTFNPVELASVDRLHGWPLRSITGWRSNPHCGFHLHQGRSSITNRREHEHPSQTSFSRAFRFCTCPCHPGRRRPGSRRRADPEAPEGPPGPRGARGGHAGPDALRRRTRDGRGPGRRRGNHDPRLRQRAGEKPGQDRAEPPGRHRRDPRLAAVHRTVPFHDGQVRPERRNAAHGRPGCPDPAGDLRWMGLRSGQRLLLRRHHRGPGFDRRESSPAEQLPRLRGRHRGGRQQPHRRDRRPDHPARPDRCRLRLGRHHAPSARSSRAGLCPAPTSTPRWPGSSPGW